MWLRDWSLITGLVINYGEGGTFEISSMLHFDFEGTIPHSAPLIRPLGSIPVSCQIIGHFKRYRCPPFLHNQYTRFTHKPLSYTICFLVLLGQIRQNT